MIRVLHVIGGMNAGGMETLVMNYYRNIDRSRIQFDFLISTRGKAFYEDEIISLGGKIYKITSRRRNPIKNYFETKQFFKNNSCNYEAVHIHQGVTNLLPLKFASKYKIRKIIVHNHGINRKIKKNLKHYINLYVKPFIEKKANCYLACSENVLNHLYSNKIINEKNYFICPNAIESDKYKFDSNIRKKIREEFDVENKIVIGHVGTFTEPKNHKFIIQLFAKLHEFNKNYVLMLVGDGKLKKEIEDMVKKLNLENNVIFTGVRKDANELMMAMDIFIFPSLYEGLPLTLIEAQYSGLFVLASNQITNECIISNSLKMVDLDLKEWFKLIISHNDNSHINKIIENKYDIKNAALELEQHYLNKISKGRRLD